MRGRSLTMTMSILAGALWASVVSAAPVTPVPVRPGAKLAPAAAIVVSRGGQAVNFALNGIALPQVGQYALSLPANSLVASASPGVQFEFARGRNWDASGNLFSGASALRSVQLSGSSLSSRFTMALTDKVSFTAGRDILALGALSLDQPSVFARDLNTRLGANAGSIGITSAKLNWNFADWGGVALSASHSTGNGSMLGVISGPIAGAMGATQTTTLGISARVGFGDGWVTSVAYSEGVTQLDLNRKPLIASTASFGSQAYGIAIAKEGLFGDDALGVAVSRPLDTYNGNGALASVPGYALTNSRVRESDVELGYVTTFLDGTLALQANAAYQVNPAGLQGETAVTGVARAKLKF